MHRRRTTGRPRVPKGERKQETGGASSRRRPPPRLPTLTRLTTIHVINETRKPHQTIYASTSIYVYLCTYVVQDPPLSFEELESLASGRPFSSSQLEELARRIKFYVNILNIHILYTLFNSARIKPDQKT